MGQKGGDPEPRNSAAAQNLVGKGGDSAREPFRIRLQPVSPDAIAVVQLDQRVLRNVAPDFAVVLADGVGVDGGAVVIPAPPAAPAGRTARAPGAGGDLLRIELQQSLPVVVLQNDHFVKLHRLARQKLSAVAGEFHRQNPCSVQQEPAGKMAALQKSGEAIAPFRRPDQQKVGRRDFSRQIFEVVTDNVPAHRAGPGQNPAFPGSQGQAAAEAVRLQRCVTGVAQPAADAPVTVRNKFKDAARGVFAELECGEVHNASETVVKGMNGSGRKSHPSCRGRRRSQSSSR